MNTQETELSLPEELVLSVTNKFKEYEDIANEWNKKAYEIIVNDENQVELMQQAKEGRLLLKAKRVEIEKTRKRLKDQSLSEGRFIDSLAKKLKEIIEPAEKHLEIQEKYAEIKEQFRKAKLKSERLELLNPYLQFADLSSFDLSTMSEVAFTTILNGCKVAYENHQKEQEEIRLKEEQEIFKNKIFSERQSKIVPYFYYAEKGDKFLTKESTEEEFLSILNVLQERAKADREQKDLLAKQNAELQKSLKISQKTIKQEQVKSKKIESIAKVNVVAFKSEIDILKDEHSNMKNTLQNALKLIIPDQLRKEIELLLKSLKK